MLGSGRHSKQGAQGEKIEMSVTPYLLRVSARFLLPELRGQILVDIKLKWGQSVTWSNSGKLFCSSTCKQF